MLLLFQTCQTSLMSHIQYGSSDEEDYLRQNLPNSRGDFVNSLRKSVSIPSGKVFDPTHFCPSWCDCCRANLALKPKYPEIKRGMSVEDALKVWDAIECIWTGVCGDDNQKFY